MAYPHNTTPQRFRKSFIASAALACLAFAPAHADQIQEPAASIIAASIAGYSGVCACPYQLKSNGAKCGRSSAYSRPGGDRLICFPDDVTPDDLAALKRD